MRVLGIEVNQKTEFELQAKSEPFPVHGYKRIAVKVVDVYGNESTVVRGLFLTRLECYGLFC